MNRNQLSRMKKLEILQMIKEKKDILFGNSTNITVTKKDIEIAWTDILHRAQLLKLAGPERKWTFMRNLFDEWKATTLAKYEKSKMNPDDQKNSFTDIDQYIFDILNISYAAGDQEKINIKMGELYEIRNKLENVVVDSKRLSVPRPTKILKIKKTNNEKYEIVNNDFKNLTRSSTMRTTTSPTINSDYSNETFETNVKRMRKEEHSIMTQDEEERQLKIELLKHDLYYRKLQCLQLERELNLPLSKFTELFTLK